MRPCDCEQRHANHRIVLTGGPGAGKTAVLEIVRHHFCPHVHILPEAAGIVFGGGFPRNHDPDILRAAQRAIFYVQRELESTAGHNPAIVLCDRGTVDGQAYWPGPDDFWASVSTTRDEQLARYSSVIHLRTPRVGLGYNHTNPLRLESAAEAARIDDAILQAWDGHPHRHVVEATVDFLVKARYVLDLIRQEVPECCRHHIRAVDDRTVAASPHLSADERRVQP